ncbi:hypothetical protein H5410_045781 [Solanum commersonii]|uniref:Aminotransferase-like plant mobile domain-containing protein n=1 Tax=Solanum commersonii TaxID=4109 RepID=A0A9J5XAI2_SOLCO|nr:hypothetical protein H5410_045781 [Solanum commersonii]
MTIFRQYISPSTKLRHLVVEIEEAEDQTRFLTHTPLVGQYLSQWLSLKNPFHMVNWTSVHTHTSNNLLKLWSLEEPDHHGYWEWTEDILGRRQVVLGMAKFMMSFMHLYSLMTVIQTFYKRSVKRGLPILGSLYEEILPEARELVGFDEKRTKYIPWTCEYCLRYEAVPPREEKKSAHPELTYNPSGGLPDTTRTFKMASLLASGRKISVAIPILAIIYNDSLCIFQWALCSLYGSIFWRGWCKDNNHAPELKPSYFISIRFNYLPLQCRDSFIIEPYSPHHFSHQFGFYQNILGIMKNDIRSASLDKGLILVEDHLQALVDIARLILVVHLEGSGKVCKNKVLNTGMPSSLGVKVLQKRKIESQLSSVTPKMKTPTQVAYVSKRLLQDESENNVSSTSRTITVSLNEENNIATPQREKSQDNGEYISCSYLMKPPSVTQVKKRLPYVSCDEGELLGKNVDSASSLKDEIQVIIKEMDWKTARKELFAVGERLTNAMFEEQDKVEEVSSIRQSLDNMKKEIRVLCKRTQGLKVLLTAVKDEVDEAKLATLFVVKEFDACSDTNLTNGLGQKKEHLEAMRQELINDKLCLD